jgi:hypothetical protein
MSLTFIFIKNYVKNKLPQLYRQLAGHQWLTPIILATQEAEIRMIILRSQPGQTVHETLSLKKKSFAKKDWGSGSKCRS